MASETTFIMVKPDGVRRGLIGEVISRFERKGFRLEQARLLTPSEELAARHYAEHDGKPFYGSLLDFITSGPVMAMEWSGESAVSAARATIGVTDPAEAAPGSIRGDHATEVQENLVHGSDSVDSAARELEIWFS
ncbi:MAG TPA: nucleoside-diphosphate kinase [Actinobacteria bacterium]|nr:nucleoside-diphosphate kinase [Actinomycetota bacterium]